MRTEFDEMMDMDEIEKYVRQRNAAMEADDLSWAARMLPDEASPRVVEMAFHKARIAITSISEEKRRESQEWLADRNTAMHLHW